MDSKSKFVHVAFSEPDEAYTEHDDNIEAYHNNKNDDQGPLRRGITKRLSVSDLSKPADLNLAKKHRNQNCIRQWDNGTYSEYSIWSTSLNQIGEFGLGLELYLRFLRRMSYAFFLISLTSIYSIYLNSQGQGLKAGSIRQRWDILTVANTELVNSSDDIEDNKSTLQKLFICDIICSALLIVFIIIYQIECSAITRKHGKKSVTVSDFTIEIKGIPRNFCDKSIVSDHFSQFGLVHDVVLAKEYKGILSAYKKRSDLMEDKAHYLVLKAKGKSVDKKLRKNQQNIEKLDFEIDKNEKSSSLKHDELPTLRAYLVFENMNSRKECLLAYKQDTNFCGTLKRSSRFMLIDKYPMKVKKADAPSNIIFTNIEVSACSRRTRKAISLICILLVFAASIAMVYSLRLYQNNLPAGEKCKDVESDKNLDYAKINYKGDTESYCWCKEQDYQDLVDSDTFEFCDYYFQRTTLIVIVRIMVSFGIVIVNFFIKFILKTLSKFERASNRNKEQVKIMNRVFYATFINTALVILLVNADFSSIKSESWMPNFLFNGEFSDFSRDWYPNVGSTIVSTMMINIFSPSWINILILYPLGACKRKCGIRGCVIQAEANSRFQGAEFDVAIKTSFIVRSIFACFLYSSGMPILNIVCFLILFSLYWIDKCLILRHYQKPPMLHSVLNDEVIKFLPFAVVFHCGFSLYMFRASEIFPIKWGENNSLADRISSFTGGVNILMILLAVTSFGWVYLYGKCFNCMMKRKVTVANDNMNSSIQDKLRNLRNQGLDTYDISKHPEFMGIIRAMDTAAVLIKEKEKDRNTA